MSSIIDTLITDRTQADVDRVEELASKGYDAMSDAENAEWSGEMKGTYNASDLNRVEKAVAILAETLQSLPDELKSFAASKGVAWDTLFDVPYDAAAYALTAKTDWVEADIPTPEQMERYLDNVITLREALNYATDALPESMDDLDWQGANAIEKALVGLDGAIEALDTAIKTLLNNTAAAWMYSGDLYAGEA